MMARYYSSSLGRFMAVDPEMNIKRNLTNPQAWNRYAYSANNPLKYVDPDGREYEGATAKQLMHRVMDRTPQTTPPASPTGQGIVGAIQAERERVSVTVSSQASFELKDSSGNVVLQMFVDPSQGSATMAGLQAHAQPGQTVAPVGGEYTPSAINASGDISQSTITIYAGSQNFSDAGQQMSSDAFVESEFVHESNHAEGPQPNENETQIKDNQKKFEQESGHR